MDELGRVRTFLKVVEAGSFSAAARHESSVSSVARQIKSLEDEIGVRLLNRNTRGLSLTEPGRVFYERALRLEQDFNTAKREAASFKDIVKGVLRVSLRITAGASMIVPALPAYLKQYPDLTIDVSLTDERVDLIANHIDVAVWIGELPDQDIVSRKLSPSRRIACASPAYFEAHGLPQTPQDLSHHNCILFNVPDYYPDFWIFEKGGSRQKVPVKGNMRTSNGVALLSAARADLGIIVVHEWTVRSDLAEGRLVRVLDEYEIQPTASEAPVHVVFPSKTGMSLKVRTFVDFLVKLFSDSTGSTTAAGAGASDSRST
ncbi:LysR family transcriptional regulator [Parapusillimonas sp. SGNA-6]|jgi:DNA-binding transcriptional LysR family regulator|nr:LysR family transcriptional regulator [Parapusillimonas sp. SGNA-6]